MKILVTGGAGYIGTMLIPYLLRRGHLVRCVDSLLYGGDGLAGVWTDPRFRFFKADIRDEDVMTFAMRDTDIVVHLAALVGDPVCDEEPDEAFAINEEAAVQAVRWAKKAGVKRFLLASTNSIYGKTDEKATEESRTNPLSVYALSKVNAERLALQARSDDFQVLALRFPTVNGISPRMRFDLILNEFCYDAVRFKSLLVYNPLAWRSHIHVWDLARGITHFLDAPTFETEIINVAGFNCRKQDIIERLEALVDDLEVTAEERGEDQRDYQVSFARSELSGFTAVVPPNQSIFEIVGALQMGLFPEENGKMAYCNG